MGQPAQEKRQVWEKLSKNMSRAQILETSRTQRGTRQEMTPSYAPHAVLQVSSVVRASSSPHVKTVRVVKYELPTVADYCHLLLFIINHCVYFYYTSCINNLFECAMS